MPAQTRNKPKKPKKTSDVYVGMLFISLVAFIGSTVLLYLHYSSYSSSTPPAVQSIKGGGGGSGSPPGRPGGSQPGSP